MTCLFYAGPALQTNDKSTLGQRPLSVGLVLDQRCRRWANSKPVLCQRLLFFIYCMDAPVVIGMKIIVNPCPARLIYLNFQPLEVVSRYREPQLQVAENY